MTKNAKRIIGIAAGVALWGFFLIQEEFAFYGIYSLISYRVHEISTLIPHICLLATVVWLVVLMKRIIQKKAVKADKWLTVLLVVLMIFQASFFHKQSQKVSATMVVTVESVDFQEGTITVKNAHGDENHVVVLDAPDLFRNMVVVGDQQYVASYDYYKINPNEGKLSGLTIMEHGND